MSKEKSDAPPLLSSAASTSWDHCADLYDLEYEQRTKYDLPFYLRHASERPPLLELACGTGRLAIPIARAGVPVVGLDPSLGMLAQAHRKADRCAHLQLAAARMERFTLSRRFGTVAIAFSSFYELLSSAQQEQTLRNLREHLLPGGRLVMDMFSPGCGSLEGAASGPEASARPRRVAELREPGSDRVHVIDESAHYQLERQRFRIDREVRTYDTPGAPAAKIRRFPIFGRYVEAAEMTTLLERCGFGLFGLYGGLDGERYESTSPMMVWVAEAV